MEKQLFRIGGVYRQQNGVIVKLEAYKAAPDWGIVERVEDDTDWSVESGGARRLDNGKYVHEFSAEHLHLLPGELHQINGEWVPVEEKKEEPTFESVRAHCIALCKTHGATAAFELLGRFNVRRLHELDPIHWATFIRECPRMARESFVPQYVKDGLRANLPAAAEPKRAPLEWNKPTRTDRWADFIVRSSSEDETLPLHKEFGSFRSPDLQPVGHQVCPGHGSALLKFVR